MAPNSALRYDGSRRECGDNPCAVTIAKVVFPALGVRFVIFGVTVSIRSYQKAEDYRMALRQYEAERTRIVSDEL